MIFAARLFMLFHFLKWRFSELEILPNGAWVEHRGHSAQCRKYTVEIVLFCVQQLRNQGWILSMCILNEYSSKDVSKV